MEAVQGNISKTQVVIIGAGPSGLSLAAQLLRYGIDFVLLEKKEGITHLSKAVVVQARTLEIFEELGLAKKAINAGRITTGINLYYKGRCRASINIEGLGTGMSAFPFALSLEQSKTEKLLSDHLAANGISIQWNSEFSHFTETEDKVTVFYKDATGHEQSIEAEYIAGSDGASSLMRHQLGLSFEGDTVPKVFYVADMILSSPVIYKDELYMFMIPKGFVLFFPMEGKGHYRVIGILPGAIDAGSLHHFSDIAEGIRKDIAVPVDFTKELWFSTYKVHSRKADTFSKGRCYILGDAAHIHTPAGGQGMNTGIQDAYNLAWKMALTLKGQANKTLLRTYSTEREENARHLLSTTDRMFDFMTGIDPFWNFLRLNFFPGLMGLVMKSGIAKRRFFPMLSQTGIAYPQSKLTITGNLGKVSSGDRMPFITSSDGTNIFDHLKAPAFKLLSFGDRKTDPEQLKRFPIKVVLHHFSEIPPVFGNSAGFYVLLRPDNHISYIGKDLAKCAELLDSISAR